MEAVPPMPIALTVLEMVQYAENPGGWNGRCVQCWREWRVGGVG